MQENSVAKVLWWIGVIAICVGVLAFLIFMVVAIEEEETVWWICAVASLLICFVEGVIFIGFAEIIELLQKKLDRTNDILAKLAGNAPNTNSSAHRELVYDIEANLPEL